MPRKPKTDERIEALIAHFEGEMDVQRVTLDALDKTRSCHQAQLEAAKSALRVLRQSNVNPEPPKPAEVKTERPKRVRKVKDDGDELAELRGKVEAEVARLAGNAVYVGSNLWNNQGLDVGHMDSWSLEDCRKALAAMRDMKPGKEAAA